VLSWWPTGAADLHAGHQETSLLLALAPDTVHLDRAAPGAAGSLAELLPRLREGGVGAVSPNGVLGDPRSASANEGRALLARLVDDLVATVAMWAEARSQP
jgi:creatinine amidohydrolase/Fe(II)-dependent formamide hydrolase-like protein